MCKYIFKNNINNVSKFVPGSKIEFQKLNTSYCCSPVFAYDYISIDNTEYSFCKQQLSNQDINMYFKKMKYLATHTINELIDNTDHTLHFKLESDHNKKITALLKQIFNQDFTDNTKPIIGHFALYTNSNDVSANNEIKSPRIYFLLGNDPVFHVLFYDPHHEIHQGSKNKNR